MKKRINMHRFFLTSILLFFICLTVCAQKHKANIIQLNLGDHTYKEMITRIQGHDSNGTKYDMRFAGSQDGNSWNFAYPDSLYAEVSSFTIDIPTYNDTISRSIGFKYINNSDTLWATSVIFADRDTTLIHADFLQTDTIDKVLTKDKNGNSVLKDVIIDFYLLTSQQDKELLSSIEATQNKFYWYNVDSSQYDIEVKKFIDLAGKYPDSHSLIGMLNSRLRIFDSKTDVQKVFNSFSEKNRSSLIGTRINEYLADTTFTNSMLPAWDTGNTEAIVIDSTKYNLVVFSASWCIPCIEEIPLLKTIYHDLSDKLDITYVSIDDSKDIAAWRQLMREKNIPWRSVLAAENLNYIKEKYYVSAIPHVLFVHPGGFKEAVEIRQPKVRSYLYQTINQQ